MHGGNHCSISVRPATVDDAATLATIGEQVFVRTYGLAIPPPTLACYVHRCLSPAAFHEDLSLAGQVYLVAETLDTALGYVKLRQAAPPPDCTVQEPTLEITSLYVALDTQGMGVGSVLMDEAVTVARRGGSVSLWLCAWRENAAALAFYQKLGFVRVGTTTIFVDDVAFADFVLARSLNVRRVGQHSLVCGGHGHDER